MLSLQMFSSLLACLYANTQFTLLLGYFFIFILDLTFAMIWSSITFGYHE